MMKQGLKARKSENHTKTKVAEKEETKEIRKEVEKEEEIENRSLDQDKKRKMKEVNEEKEEKEDMDKKGKKETKEKASKNKTVIRMPMLKKESAIEIQEMINDIADNRQQQMVEKEVLKRLTKTRKQQQKKQI